MKKDKVALITGSATGLATQIAKNLASSGINIILNYRTNVSSIEILKKQVEDLGVQCITIQGDVTDASDCAKMVDAAVKAFGKIDILVNNAGPYIFERKKMAEYEVDEWNYIVNGNLNAVFYLTRCAIPYMRKQQWGRIINVGFANAAQASGWGYRSAFAAAKVGLVSLTRTLAQEEAENGITVNMICPGDIKGNDKESTISQIRKSDKGNNAPIGRPGSGEDIGRVVTFLTSENSDFITGSIIDVTGGFHIKG